MNWENVKAAFYGANVGLYRGYALFGSLITLLSYFFLATDNFDPIWLRGFPWLAFTICWVGSFFIPYIKENIVLLFNLSLSLAAAWLGIMLAANNFGDAYLSAFLIATVASILTIQKRLAMLIFSIWTTLVLCLAIIFAESSEQDFSLIFIAIIGVLVVANVSIGARFHRREIMTGSLVRANIMHDTTLDSSRDAILVVDEGGNLKKCNPSYLKMWGVPRSWVKDNLQDKIMGQYMVLTGNSELVKKTLGGSDTPLDDGEILEINFKDGRIVEAYWVPMKMGENSIGRLWFFRDISHKKKEEKRLRDSEQRLRKNNERLKEFAANKALITGNLDVAFSEISKVSAGLLEVNTVGIWILNQSGDLMVCKKFYNRESDSFLHNISIPVANHLEYLAVIEKNRTLTINDTRENVLTEEFYEGQYTGQTMAMLHAQIRISGRMVGVISFEEAEKPREWTLEDETFAASMADLVAVSLEANERRKALVELGNSNSVLQAIFDLSETGIIVEDNEHRVIDFNDLYLEIWNMERHFVENAPYNEQIAHCREQTLNSEGYTKGLKQLKERPGMEYAGIIEFVDGKVVERYSKAIEQGGEIWGRVWFYLDITDRKKKEQELISRNFELDSFVYRASHDLKAPLNSIMGLINIVKEEKDVDLILSYIGMMDKSVEKLDAFIKQLTQFSQDARLKVVRQPILFNEMVESILEDLRYMEKADQIKIEVNVEQRGEFLSDPIRLGIVINNIISNAIKYQDMKKESAYLQISVIADHEQAVCKFVDNGLGIDPIHLEKVFDLFFRASVQATGSGLGLYITHNAVGKMGGKIKLVSNIGEGTTFSLQIPNRISSQK